MTGEPDAFCRCSICVKSGHPMRLLSDDERTIASLRGQVETLQAELAAAKDETGLAWESAQHWKKRWEFQCGETDAGAAQRVHALAQRDRARDIAAHLEAGGDRRRAQHFIDVVVLGMANERAERWKQRCFAARKAQLTRKDVVEAASGVLEDAGLQPIVVSALANEIANFLPETKP